MAWDPIWEKIFIEKDWGKYPSEDFIRFVALNYYDVPGRNKVKILEVGCGTGANLWYLAREGFSVYGVDGSSSAVMRARQRLDCECPNWQGQIIVGDIVCLPFKDGFFDAVIDNEAVYCNSFDESMKIYDEMARVCKTGGKIYIRTFATGSWGYRTGMQLGHNAWLVSEGPLAGKGYSRFTDKEEIMKLLSGFRIETTELLIRTVNNMQQDIKEWSIIGHKL